MVVERLPMMVDEIARPDAAAAAIVTCTMLHTSAAITFSSSSRRVNGFTLPRI